MWLTTPQTIEQVLAERPLELLSNEEIGPVQAEQPLESADSMGFESPAREWQDRGPKHIPPGALRQMPIVQIGQPETWVLQDLYTPGELPRPIQTKLNEADFYIVRLSCSFRPVHDESRIEWARFQATLFPDATGAQPFAFDLYPEQIVKEEKRQTKVTLSPQLKFKEVEASLGNTEFGFEYTELIPMVSAAMGESFDPSWDYRAAPGQQVQGVKWMYLLIKAPKGMKSATVLLELEADLLVRGVSLSATFWRKQEQATAAKLAVKLWG